MFALLPLICLALIGLWIKPYAASWRGTLFYATVLWGVLVVAITEILSLFHGLTVSGVLFVWSITIILLLAGIARHISKTPVLLGQLRTRWQNVAFTEKILLIGMGVIFGITGIIALAAPPNTWDVVSYHMPRVFFWEQYQTLAPFPTHTNRQIYQPPFAEFIILHLQLLSGSDQFANIAQWAVLILTGIGVSATAKQLGANLFGQIFSAVLGVSLPIGILQATGAKNDLMTAFWVICLAYFVIEDIHHRVTEASQRNNFFVFLVPSRFVFFIGAAAGLALLTKGTAYPCIAPLLIWYFVTKWRQNLELNLQSIEKTHDAVGIRYIVSIRIPLKYLLFTGSIAILLNAGHWLRNFSVYGTPLTAPSHSIYYANEIFSPAVLVSNSIRNLALHVFIPSQQLSEAITQTINHLHHLIGLNSSDLRTTFPGDTFALPLIWQIFNEDRAGNPLHLALFGIAIVLLPALNWKNRPSKNKIIPTPKPAPFHREGKPTPPFYTVRGQAGEDKRTASIQNLIIYACIILSSFLLFSLLLKWQVWGTRLQLPFFVLIAPFTGTVFAAVLPRWFNFLIGLILLGVALFIAMNGVPRPLFASTDYHALALGFYTGSENIDYESVLVQPRLEQYFNSRHEWYAPSLQAAEKIAALDCASVGLVSDENGWLYPLMMLLKTQNPAITMQYVNVQNETASLAQYPPFADFIPCAIIEIHGQRALLPDPATLNGKPYQQYWKNSLYSILVPENS